MGVTFESKFIGFPAACPIPNLTRLGLPEIVGVDIYGMPNFRTALAGMSDCKV